MEYSLVVAPSLETLAEEVAVFFPKGWKLKGAILEHHQGYAQQLVRKPSDSIRVRKQQVQLPVQQQKRTKWIE